MIRILHLLFVSTFAYKLKIHPLENKIAYVTGINYIENLDKQTLDYFKKSFNI